MIKVDTVQYKRFPGIDLTSGAINTEGTYMRYSPSAPADVPRLDLVI
jgi:hypothetical protein